LATKELAVASWQRAVSHFLFRQGIFERKKNNNNKTPVFPQPHYFSVFPRWKIKLKGRHFDSVDAIEAESRTVLNTLTEHVFQDEFKNGRSAGNDA
jgi:hypothetical protein